MERALVMTVIGKDKPGLVESVSSIIVEHGGNWLESRMSRLGGYFAGILRVAVPSENQAKLSAALHSLKGGGLDVVIHLDEAPGLEPGGKEQRMEIVGQDRPGIVRSITEALARQGVNVEEFQSETCSAAMSGESLFRAEITMRLPEGCDSTALQRELEDIASDLIVEVRFCEPG